MNSGQKRLISIKQRDCVHPDILATTSFGLQETYVLLQTPSWTTLLHHEDRSDNVLSVLCEERSFLILLLQSKLVIWNKHLKLCLEVVFDVVHTLHEVMLFTCVIKEECNIWILSRSSTRTFSNCYCASHSSWRGIMIWSSSWNECQVCTVKYVMCARSSNEKCSFFWLMKSKSFFTCAAPICGSSLSEALLLI